MNLRNEIEKLYGEYRELSLERQRKLEAVAIAIDDYNASRSELVKEELAARNMDWCTYCSKESARDSMALILIEGTSEYSFGYEGGDYGFRTFSTLHRMCSSCQSNTAERHGWVGPYNHSCRTQEKFYAFAVEKKEDGYYANKFGSSTKLPKECEERLVWEPPKEVVERLTQAWNLPGRIELDHMGTLHMPD
jgi:hypothetical protein